MASTDPTVLSSSDALRRHLLQGHVIPAHPLALTAERRLDERSQRALTRYYFASGAGGIAVGVHTTQFAIREPGHGLYRPVLELASVTADAELLKSPRPFVKVAGLVGKTAQAVDEAETALSLGYHCGLLSLGAWRASDEGDILEHCSSVAEAIPLFGFYLQPAVGGRVLSYEFWREFAELPNVVAIKIAPFNRYQTLDVIRAVADSGRTDIALYTGNDDAIILDLLTKYPCSRPEGGYLRMAGGLLGQWAVWTEAAVRMREQVIEERQSDIIAAYTLSLAAELTDANSAIFDAANSFKGCIPGINEVLKRQGLMRDNLCLDEHEALSTGQTDELDRVCNAYPHLADDSFVEQHLDEWLS